MWQQFAKPESPSPIWRPRPSFSWQKSYPPVTQECKFQLILYAALPGESSPPPLYEILLAPPRPPPPPPPPPAANPEFFPLFKKDAQILQPSSALSFLGLSRFSPFPFPCTVKIYTRPSCSSASTSSSPPPALLPGKTAASIIILMSGEE